MLGLYSDLCTDIFNIRQDIKVSQDELPDEYSTGNIIKDQHYDLAIGILSARSNIYLRENLRKTWVGHAQQYAPLKRR